MLQRSRFSFRTGWVRWAHRLGEKIRVGASRTHLMTGCWMPPPQDLLHALNPITFQRNLRLRSGFEVLDASVLFRMVRCFGTRRLAFSEISLESPVSNRV